ncbi:RolB family protein, partial [bacterium]|nr:RolB family protein [bacterium]
MSNFPNNLWSNLKNLPRRVGRFWAGWLPTGSGWSFVVLIFVIVLLVFMIPAPAGDAYELQIPSSGETVSTAFPLKEGRLYKVTVSGVYRYRNDGMADAQFRSVDASYDDLQPSVMLNGSLVRAQVLDLAEHRYTFYVAGDGQPLTANIYDHWGRGFADDSGPYWDNGGYLTLNVREADFRCQPRHSSNAGYLVRYDLDPIPEPADTVTLKLWRILGEEERELVFAAATDEPVAAYGDRNRLSRDASNRFLWNGIGNIGSYADGLAPFGDYVIELVVESRGKRFSTVNWEEPGSLTHLVVLPGGDSPDGAFQMVFSTNSDGRRLYGYKSPRAITPTFGPEMVELASSGLTCLAWQPGITDAEGYDSPVLAYLKRRLNLALTTAFEQQGEVFPFCTDSDGQFDEELIRLLTAFRREFDYETPTETAFLQRFGNLGTGTGEGAIPAVYYSRVVGMETFTALDELTFSLPGLPGEWNLNDFDNLPLYDAENPRRSLYHRFAENCAWIQELRPDGKAHPGWEIDRDLLDWGKRYDLAPAAFQAFCEAVSYQECGLMHVLGSGRSYRAASGHGSATGYSQLTGAVVHGGNYQLRYPNGGEIQRVAFASLPQETRYDLRYLAELNLQVGIQYLRLVISTQSRWEFDPRFQEAFRPGGVLDFTTWGGTVRRLKMAGVMYNAGPYGIKVILRDIYSTIPPPPRGTREADYYAGQMAAIPTLRAIEEELSDTSEDETEPLVEETPATLMAIPADFPWSAPPAYNMDYEGMPGLDYFFGACEGDIEPFLIRFALDLRRYIAGEYHFPCESYPGGVERLYEIFRMLGPFWINRGAGGDWARAALMKLEREVIGYVRGMGRNVPVFWDSDEV